MASPYGSYAPGSAGKTVYETSSNHYRIHDTRADGRAVAVRNGDSCPGDLPREVTGRLCVKTGVGLGSNPNGYRFGAATCFNA